MSLRELDITREEAAAEYRATDLRAEIEAQFAKLFATEVTDYLTIDDVMNAETVEQKVHVFGAFRDMVIADINEYGIDLEYEWESVK